MKKQKAGKTKQYSLWFTDSDIIAVIERQRAEWAKEKNLKTLSANDYMRELLRRSGELCNTISPLSNIGGADQAVPHS